MSRPPIQKPMTPEEGDAVCEMVLQLCQRLKEWKDEEPAAPPRVVVRHISGRRRPRACRKVAA